jgi:hypothetical protein
LLSFTFKLEGTTNVEPSVALTVTEADSEMETSYASDASSENSIFVRGKTRPAHRGTTPDMM